MENGISFMMRVHDEEDVMEKSIRSLIDGLTIPYELVVILHLCTDRSEAIAHRLAAESTKIRIVHYTHPVSRAGYETLATDESSCHSLAAYCSWCHRQCKCRWVFKWDADFLASPGLIRYLNGRTWLATDAPERVHISAQNTDMKNKECYLTSALICYKKHFFWETSFFTLNALMTYAPEDATIEHYSLLTDLKSYWQPSHRPWYETEESDEARIVRDRMRQLVRDFGEPPVGMARASNPVCDRYYLAIQKANPSYVRITE
jgi:hypothetical protein